MLLYRAINDFSDENNINKGNGIIASQPSQGATKKTCLKQYAASHVGSASNPNVTDCWISTSKDFKKCVSEFSIPQMGGYNTATQRKKIAVIDRNKMINSNLNYISNGNYTYVSDGRVALDLCDSRVWPRSTRSGRYKIKKIVYPSHNVLKVDKKLMDKHIMYFKNFLNSSGNTGRFIFDMTFPSPADRNSKYVPLNEFSYYDYINYEIISKTQGMPIISGTIKKHSEVLILDAIPSNSIIRILTFIEIDVLYALDITSFRNVLDDIIKGITVINIQGKKVFINGNPLNLNNKELSLVDKLYNKNSSIIDLTYYIYQNTRNANTQSILHIYYYLKELKRNIIKKILYAIKQNSDMSIVEDEIFVAEKNNNQLSNNMHPLQLCRYDLLLIGDATNKNIYKFDDPVYLRIWKDSLTSNFKTINNYGQIVDCHFSLK